MTDVFISYARSTAREAHSVAEALRTLGYGVWRDDELPAHRAYAKVIEERLHAARAVLVLWSKAAVASEWVQAEADRGRAGGKLVQLRLDDVKLPMPFDRFECADLRDWTGEADVPGWRKVVASIAELAGEAHETPALTAPEHLLSRPSIAVMPFTNLSNDPEQAYFAEGMVEEIVGSLSRFKSIYVLAAGVDGIYRGRADTPHEAARRLGVRYLLEGSVRKSGGQVRVALHLIDASNGAELWTDRLDGTMDNVFALQDRAALRVAGVIETAVQDLDSLKVSMHPTANAGSYDLYMRSLPLFQTFRKTEMLEATSYLDRAIALDPYFALALSQSAICHRQIVEHGWGDDLEAYRRRGLELNERALRLADGDAKVMAQVAAGFAGLDPDMARPIALVGRAIQANSGSSFVWLISGMLRLRNGDPDIAAEHLETAIRLDPISTMNGLGRMYLASARFQQDRLDEALALYRTTSFRLPVSHVTLAALHGYLGQRTQAQAALADFTALEAGSVEDFGRIWFPRPEHRARFFEGVALGRTEPA